jgi:hypothetical protein
MKLSFSAIFVTLISVMLLPSAAFGQGLIISDGVERTFQHRIVEVQTIKMPIFVATIVLATSLIVISVAVSKSWRVG